MIRKKIPFFTVTAAEPPPAFADEGSLPVLGNSVVWLNYDPLSRESLRGKVVLVNFWIYSCINSLRELPYMKSWAAKYKDAGQVVIGVHAPEFMFEKERANVENAVRELNIAYPVAIDSNHKIWDAFKNEYCPADYFIDAKGRIRHPHFGEGEYDESERVIQQLLKENGATDLNWGLVRTSAVGVEEAPSRDIRSPETYVGYRRAEVSYLLNERRKICQGPTVPRRQWGLGGSCIVGAESAALSAASGKIVFRFHSRDLHMVLAPNKNGKPVRFRVKWDGVVPGVDRGGDSSLDGAGEVQEPLLYQLIRQRGRVKDRTFEIEFLDPGIQAFSFTFG